ncbi:hypothetical protein W822_17715 [Advenella kashmirensis W13003]|uniref:DUF2169 domain-containing protein n=1 Tax=Advenella kashmirensis W13003 TaxID=1424334 RepID=V8QN45_9BURK|nr:DUF2169 domain-containing protein [Advenella kashmirensis]ETF01401.1 hypothetical protein W822_17715 [Advenella kashmirensis W13003]
MKTVKPLRLGVLTRPFGLQEKSYLGVVVYALVDFNGESPKLVPDAELTTHLLHDMDCEGILDLVLPKPVPEFLVSGKAYTAHQQDKTRCAVRVQVDKLEKSLLVSGERYWLDGTMTAPQTFDEMPVSWNHAYGGADFAENPGGKGRDREWINGSWVRRLPNVEVPTSTMQRPDQAILPASFGPVLLTRPRRYSQVGTFSQEWMQTDMNAFFHDMDPRLFNAAEPDQRWPERDSLPLGSSFRIWNMHPEQHCWSGTLPDWKARCFVLQQIASAREPEHEVFLEVDLRPTTVWFLPNIRHAILMYHGALPVAQSYAEDALAILPAMELPDQPKNQSYYRKVFDQRNDMETGALYTLRDRDLVPKSIMGDWLDTKPQLQSPFLDNAHKFEQRKRAQIRAFLDKHGTNLPDSERNELNALVPEFVGPPFPADPEHMPELHERMQKLKADAMEQLEAQKQSTRQQLSELNAVDPQHAGSTDTEGAAPALDAAQIEEIGRHIDSPAPADRQKLRDAFGELAKQQEKLEAEWEKWSQQHGDPDNTTAKLENMTQQREQARKQLGKINLYSAHLIGGKIIVDSHVADKKRFEAQRRYADGQSIQDMDLAGADLSSLAFVDADISGSDLSGANLNGAVFRRCNLTDVILSRASIQDASFTDCELNGTNLGETQVERSNFSGSRLKKVILHKTEFSRCDFRQTQWQDVLNNTHARFSACRFDASSADKTVFVQCHFENSSFYQAKFSQTIFQQTTLVNVNFEQSQQKSAGFVACDMDTINFSQARLDGVSFIYKLNIRHCAFRETRLKGCSFKGTVLHGIQAQKARLQYCDLTLADLRNADFTGADMHHCVLKSADLRDSLFNQADFTSAILTKADLRGADLRYANFCTADISEVRMDNTTLIQNIYTEHTKRYPLYRESFPQQDAVRP